MDTRSVEVVMMKEEVAGEEAVLDREEVERLVVSFDIMVVQMGVSPMTDPMLKYTVPDVLALYAMSMNLHWSAGRSRVLAATLTVAEYETVHVQPIVNDEDWSN